MWYEEVLANPDLRTTHKLEKKFHRNLSKIVVEYRTSQITLGAASDKRVKIYDNEGRWVATKPIHIEEEGLIAQVIKSFPGL